MERKLSERVVRADIVVFVAVRFSVAVDYGRDHSHLPRENLFWKLLVRHRLFDLSCNASSHANG